MARTANAIDGFSTGKRQGREQEIFTPRVIVDVLHEVWPEGIALDPCAGRGSLIAAATNYYGRRVHAPTEKTPDRHVWRGQGLVLPWKRRTYWNPPFDNLEAWMEKAYAESLKFPEQVGMVPVRPRRDWWRDHAERFDAIAWLDALAFHGYEHQFPESLILGYRGKRVAAFKHAVERRGIGEIRPWGRSRIRKGAVA